MAHDYDRLVDVENGTVSREIFVSDSIFKEEMDKIFTRAWLFVGHEDLIKKPDDYFVSRMGMDSVILTRDRENKINVLLNSCMHRGMKVCRYDRGNTRAFTCPYHGWSYSTDGRLVEVPGELVGVPGFKSYYHEKLEKRRWGLIYCPKVVNYKGTIWATWDENAPDFLDYLGDMKHYLDAALDNRDGTPGGSEMIGGVQKWRVKCNWKFAPENFIGDMYHDISHRSVDLVGIGPSEGKGRRDRTLNRTTVSFDDRGHGVIGTLPHYEEPPFQETYKNTPAIADYLKDVYDRRVANLGSDMRVGTSVGTIFPNMSFHGRQPRTIGVFHPISPTEMEMWRIFLVDRDAPQALKDSARHYYMRYSGPGGMTESDDLENWQYATEASAGNVARRYHYNYQMGLGFEKPVPEFPGASENGEYSEGNARAFYRQWRKVMSSDAPTHFVRPGTNSGECETAGADDCTSEAHNA
ncbi:aromatic ring-hydroxylating oxygenase subunit alpha [Aminobacter aminovorans]|uniref:Hydrogenase n=1 Tax=Aminobacter aminovorans TaxID=83263 RepID=A0AAC8YKT5_AMIAI|nr:aromatic ring-hydroxylating dioxygenase subunit alpha [Aminobacter aminovorans]AMS40128.1 hydrogenase [Aminobacter aminovorans]MBB3710135.1 phenylpropionate dioxygenase-like ring-hydroxylating dioxygenase large terminal subunit [Aminobacter aminovorans]